MSSYLPNLQAIARALGGEVNGKTVHCPGPGHSRADRSMMVSLDNKTKSGFVVYSFSGDDWQECKDYVRNKLGIDRETTKPKDFSSLWPTKIDTANERDAKARELWASARTEDLHQQLRLIYPHIFRDEDAWNEAYRMKNVR